MIYRIFDIILAFIAGIILLIPFVLIYLAIWASSGRPVIHWSKRIGGKNVLFLMPKFRTMRLDTPQIAVMANGNQYVTTTGRFLRKTSLDEIPQILSVLKGDMSLVGPRPALFNQDDLIEMRTQLGIHHLLPGVTGWAQVNGRDNLPLEKKVDLDFEYFKNRSVYLYFKIIFLTVYNVIRRKDINY